MNDPKTSPSDEGVHPAVASFLMTLDKFGMGKETKAAFQRLSPTQKVLMGMQMRKAVKENQIRKAEERRKKGLELEAAMNARCETCSKSRATCKAKVSIKAKDGEVVVDCDGIELVDRLRNLCDTCLLSLPTCPAKGIAFGDGKGKDNVIRCQSWTERKEEVNASL